jgi:hypothetical protein
MPSSSEYQALSTLKMFPFTVTGRGCKTAIPAAFQSISRADRALARKRFQASARQSLLD